MLLAYNTVNGLNNDNAYKTIFRVFIHYNNLLLQRNTVLHISKIPKQMLNTYLPVSRNNILTLFHLG